MIKFLHYQQTLCQIIWWRVKIILVYNDHTLFFLRPHHGIETLEAAIKEVDCIPAYLPSCLELTDCVSRAREWIQEADALQVHFTCFYHIVLCNVLPCGWMHLTLFCFFSTGWRAYPCSFYTFWTGVKSQRYSSNVGTLDPAGKFGVWSTGLEGERS